MGWEEGARWRRIVEEGMFLIPMFIMEMILTRTHLSDSVIGLQMFSSSNAVTNSRAHLCASRSGKCHRLVERRLVSPHVPRQYPTFI